MSYQVLARKWRPKSFEQLIGQEHVLRALINALDSQRIHHAFLFSGTRGVGKTTIARIFAKSLNCEKGISSTPCGECSTCIEIDEGHFVDLIEVDAASRTKVEDTRDLLDNVQYAPTRGSYKVYLIDEVHMLSNHSFNALLKTLEEPPPHVKFLLATTDPQKLPVTILSRCLQFNLRRISVENINKYLQNILKSEDVKFEESAVNNIAKAADGSMRDALSILDQGISFGNGTLLDSDIRMMLGSIEKTHIFVILEALANNNANQLITCVNDLYDQAVDFSILLNELLTSLHNIALLQKVPNAYDEQMGDKNRLDDLVNNIQTEDIQLYYQIGLIGQRDLALAPNPKVGFEMVVLRMLAFRPNSNKKKHNIIATQPSERHSEESKQFDKEAIITNDDASDLKPEPQTVEDNTKFTDSWDTLVSSLNLSGLDKQLLMNCVLISNENNDYELVLSPNNSSLLTKERVNKIEKNIADSIGKKIKLSINIKNTDGETLAEKNERQIEIKNNKAKESIQNDKNVQDIIDTFSASINNKSVKPI
ncbi:MAG: DNA polymerase III subunit gamma/tau [Gammaproteobacteria bacterium]